jgi:hypothetical protein
MGRTPFLFKDDDMEYDFEKRFRYFVKQETLSMLNVRSDIVRNEYSSVVVS